MQETKFLERQRVVLLIIHCCEVKSTTFNSTDAKELLSRMLLNVAAPDVIAAKTLWHDPITHERCWLFFTYKHLCIVHCLKAF